MQSLERIDDTGRAFGRVFRLGFHPPVSVSRVVVYHAVFRLEQPFVELQDVADVLSDAAVEVLVAAGAVDFKRQAADELSDLGNEVEVIGDESTPITHYSMPNIRRGKRNRQVVWMWSVPGRLGASNAAPAAPAEQLLLMRPRRYVLCRMRHPSDDIRGSLGAELDGVRIAHCISGSVAAVRAPEIARLLIRHGADVHVVMSEAATGIIHPDLMHWSTGRSVVTQLTGEIEHVALAGNVEDKADLVLVAPATANTIGKIAAGIDDTPVTTVVTTAFGEGIPILIVPAMHEPMYRHPIVAENIKRLRGLGVGFVQPTVEEGKAKIPSPQDICAAVLERVRPSGSPSEGAEGESGRPLCGRTVVITAGRTVEYLDPIRVLTNNSSGKMGMALAAAALEAGAAVTVIYGKGTATPPAGARVIRVDTSESMRTAVDEELAAGSCHVFIAAAAVGDWRPVKRSEKKITTHGTDRLTIELEPTPKIIDGVKQQAPGVFLVAFRAQHDLSTEDLVEDAHRRAEKAHADLIAVNDVSRKGTGFETDTNEVYLVSPDKTVQHLPLASKTEVGRRIIAAIAERLLRAQ